VDIAVRHVSYPGLYLHWSGERSDIIFAAPVHALGSDLILANAEVNYRVKAEDFAPLGKVLAAMTHL
jgi:hypothetical protein